MSNLLKLFMDSLLKESLLCVVWYIVIHNSITGKIAESDDKHHY